MKVGILIQDLTIDQARTVLNDLGGLSAPASVSIVDQNDEDDNSGVTVTQVGALDVKGLPWDERIHASTKAQNADGSWKKRRGVQDFVVEEVEAELRSRQNPVANTVIAAPIAPQQAAPVPAPFLAPQAPVPAAPVAAQPIPAALVPAPVAAPVEPAKPTRDFNGLLVHLGNLFKNEKIAQEYPDTIVQRINAGFQIDTVKTITDIGNNPQMVDYAWQCIDVDGYSV